LNWDRGDWRQDNCTALVARHKGVYARLRRAMKRAMSTLHQQRNLDGVRNAGRHPSAGVGGVPGLRATCPAGAGQVPLHPGYES